MHRMSVRTRGVALAPLVLLTVLTVAAGETGYHASQDSPGATEPVAVAAPTSSPSASPTPWINQTPGPIPPVPTFAPATLTEARYAWAHGLDKLIAAGSGKYSWAVYVGSSTEPLQSENGAFDLDPLRSRFDRRTAGPDGDPVTMHVRRIGTTTYMRFDDWGQWDGCWLSVTNADVERATGVETSRAVPLPASVLAIGDATPTVARGFWFGTPYREYSSKLPASEALQFLGVSAKVYLHQIDRLNKVMVPITVSLDDAGRMHGGGARGSEIAKALKAAHVKLSRNLLEALPSVRASFAFREPGSAVSVQTPPPALLLPHNPTRSDTCKGGGPHA
jgi:hypothetical protein